MIRVSSVTTRPHFTIWNWPIPVVLRSRDLIFCPSQLDKSLDPFLLPSSLPRTQDTLDHLGYNYRKSSNIHNYRLASRLTMSSNQLLLEKMGWWTLWEVSEYQCTGIFECGCQYCNGYLDVDTSFDATLRSQFALEKEDWCGCHVEYWYYVSTSSSLIDIL